MRSPDDLKLLEFACILGPKGPNWSGLVSMYNARVSGTLAHNRVIFMLLFLSQGPFGPLFGRKYLQFGLFSVVWLLLCTPAIDSRSPRHLPVIAG